MKTLKHFNIILQYAQCLWNYGIPITEQCLLTLQSVCHHPMGTVDHQIRTRRNSFFEVFIPISNLNIASKQPTEAVTWRGSSRIFFDRTVSKLDPRLYSANRKSVRIQACFFARIYDLTPWPDPVSFLVELKLETTSQHSFITSITFQTPKNRFSRCSSTTLELVP